MSRSPNFLFLQLEDAGRHLGCYGDTAGKTPNMDRLASEGALYTNAFTHCPVCAPSRGGMVTGCYPWSIGNQFMRCDVLEPPRTFTHELVRAGYHVSWPTKLDFNFTPGEGWCSDQDFWWEKPAPEQPFFLYENFVHTHESRMFRELSHIHGKMPYFCPSECRHHPDEIPVPPYLPDTPELRWQLVRYYDALSANDYRIGQRLQWLEDQGLSDETIVILLSDHGRGLPREKRWCYDAGLHLPLVIRHPGEIAPGTTEDELVAWVDIAPTVLSLAGVAIPDHYQGQVFMGPDRAPERSHVFAGRDRMDSIYDMVRVARDHHYHYIRNDAPGLPYAQYQAYMEKQPIMPLMRDLHAKGQLKGDEAVFFQPEKPREELYDTQADPNQLNNLAKDPAHSEALQALRTALDQHLAETGDLSEIDEKVLADRGLVRDDVEALTQQNRVCPLPPEQQLGPVPIPATRSQAEPWLWTASG
ncbi:sulfatase family protein [Puniceicoccus vermicola]|uniref:Sulfatase n=1 Tax=Puniceicoccus vermicola TaxID=388746 RepID=A0A7X1B099_9BACT|nr:sulfatase [Puniceicoccus vermicola]MBC2603209.1 sulfatase [Puniceicoccus vermicola]